MRFVFIILFGLSVPSPKIFAAENCARAIDVSFDFFQSPNHEESLKQATLEMIRRYSGYLVTPTKVIYVNQPHRSIFYDQGGIFSRFPFFGHFGPPIGRLEKSVEDSIPIHLHELGHQILEETIREWYKDKPEVIWAFYTRTDMYKEESLLYIRKTKGLTSYADKTDDWILDHFFKISVIAEIYNEAIADMLTVLDLGDPDAIFRSIHFSEVGQNGGVVEQKSQEDKELRRWNQDNSLEEMRRVFRKSAYGNLSLAQTFIWREIYEKSEKSEKPLPVGLVAQRLIKSILISFEYVTDGFKMDRNLTVDEMNSHLIDQLKKDFNIDSSVR